MFIDEVKKLLWEYRYVISRAAGAGFILGVLLGGVFFVKDIDAFFAANF